MEYTETIRNNRGILFLISVIFVISVETSFLRAQLTRGDDVFRSKPDCVARTGKSDVAQALAKGLSREYHRPPLKLNRARMDSI